MLAGVPEVRPLRAAPGRNDGVGAVPIFIPFMVSRRFWALPSSRA